MDKIHFIKHHQDKFRFIIINFIKIIDIIHSHHRIHQGNDNIEFFEFILNFSNSCIYTCQNSLLGNYSEENGTSNMIPSMPLDLYGLSVTPPVPSSPHTPSNLTSPVDTIPSSTTKQDQNSPVIYPWMRKVHINNPG
jgi:hypothetical protein